MHSKLLCYKIQDKMTMSSRENPYFNLMDPAILSLAGIGAPEKWSPEQIELLKKLYGEMEHHNISDSKKKNQVAVNFICKR